LPRYFSMRDHAQQLEVEIQDLQRMTKALRGDIDRLEHDPVKIEQLARERLGYVRKGETVYQVIPDSQKRSRP
jgi:cell division protein FtsB